MIAATTATRLASEIVVGDIIVFGTMTGVARTRVTAITRLDVRIDYPHKRTSVVYPTVRLHFGTGGESLDYSPDSVLNLA